MPNGFTDGGGGFDPGTIFNSLLGELADVIQAILQFLADLVGAIVNALNFLWDGLLSLLGINVSGLSDISDLDHGLWDETLGGDVFDGISSAFDWLSGFWDWIKKILTILKAIQKQQQKLMLQALRTIVNLIQRARQILVLFRLMHVKIAQRLDNWLLTIEGSIIAHVYAMVRKQNTVIGWINVLLDPAGGMRSTTWARMLGGMLAAINAFFAGIGLRDLLPSLFSFPGALPATPTLAQFQSQLVQDYGASTGLFAGGSAGMLVVYNRIRGEGS